VSRPPIRFTAHSPDLRLDLTLVEHLSDFSRSRLQSIIRAGCVKVDGVQVTKPGTKLDGGELVEVRIPETAPAEIEPEAIPLEVIFEDEHVLLVNKPAGMVVHPSAGHHRGTLVHAALAHAPDIAGVGGKRRPGVVHRLDKDTSGLIILAKTDRAHHSIQRQFKHREVEKTYIALVDGTPPTPSGRVEAAIARDPRHRKRMAVVKDDQGRAAVTVYHTAERLPDHTLLEVHPHTGRTHQIRVHLAFLGCPIAADPVYGRRQPSVDLGRHFLHAAGLKFRLPGEETKREFQAPLPEDLVRLLERLRAG
jgi:23S rRNA pseudouridine1911/1915/1917 synthase